jgi:hypothetical protein
MVTTQAHTGRASGQPVVALINTAHESIELLQEVMAEAGFATVAAFVVEFKRGERDLRAFFAEHRPQAVIYDIAIPYVENWHFFREQILGLGFLPQNRFIDKQDHPGHPGGTDTDHRNDRPALRYRSNRRGSTACHG